MKAPSRATFTRLTKSLLAVMFAAGILCASMPLVPQAAIAQADQSMKPKLVLMVVADQFSYNFLSRYEDKLQSGGLKYLMEHGANYASCYLDCATTHRDAGNSAIANAAYPWQTGVVGNQWYSRSKKTLTSSIEDDSATLVGANGKAGSNKGIKGTTIGDQMKLSTNGRSKVLSIGVDESPALILGGRLANNAYWFDAKSGAMVSSSKYGTTVSGWVKAFNDQHYADRYMGKPWQRLMPETQYAASTRDDYPYEQSMQGDGRQFPHVITGTRATEGDEYYSSFAMTPFANQMILDFARDAVEKEFLGQHVDPDLLILGLNAGERLTQAFGPYSQETQDLVLRMDQSLASLFQFIDSKIGLNKCLIIFTASHGGPTIPEFSQQRGLDAGRVNPKVFMSFLDAKLDSRVGPEDWIEAFEPPNLYLNLDAIDKQKLRQPDVESLLSKIAHSVPGIGEVVTAWQLYTNQPPNNAIIDGVRRSYAFGRSGELYVTPRPGYVFSDQSNGTGYGSPYTYDSQVPLILCGAGIRPGLFTSKVSTVDIAPTISAILGLEAPSLCEGKPLSEAVAQVFGPPAPRVQPQPVQPADDSKDKKKKKR